MLHQERDLEWSHGADEIENFYCLSGLCDKVLHSSCRRGQGFCDLPPVFPRAPGILLKQKTNWKFRFEMKLAVLL